MLKETPSPYLAIVFVGQYEVFVCLAFDHFFFSLFGCEAHRSANRVQSLNKVRVSP